EIVVPWGESVRSEQIVEALGNHPEARGVVVVHSETSTGAAADVRSIAAAVRGHSDALVIVDGITAVGALEFRLDEWGVDVCVTGSQKGLMIPPGLAFVALGPRAVAAMENSTVPHFYFSLRKAVESWKKHDTPWTPAVSLIIGVDRALEMIRSEGIEEVWARHDRLAGALRAGVGAVGLKVFAQSPSNAVTPVVVPEGLDWGAFNRSLKIDDGITVAGGQDHYKGKIFRVSHLGYYDDLDMVTVMSAIERALVQQKFSFRQGEGVAATHRSLIGHG
ncbi:MAG: aminotransferase class V-fold PLP-dependent enzyme, partial [Ignavibacteria bacterium]|nr:aminotransferase class V-fold PLP-dependent enzyme [Ignavibacteria bacterium]